MYSIDYNDLVDDNFWSLDRKLTPRLELKNNVSPIKVERLFRKLLNISKSDTSIINGFDITSDDKNEKLLNALSFSFKFNKNKFTRYNYNTYIEQLYNDKYPSLDRFKIIDFLTEEQVNIVREIFIKMQNRNLFKNYSENRTANIITNNFQKENKNIGNSLSKNRQFLKDLRPLHSKNNKLLYYENDLNLVKPHLLRLYLPIHKG